ncbi:MAG: hypothetical protein WCE69_13210 [Aestuariivirga sp.]
MTIKSRMIEEFSFSNEDNLAGTCSSALRKVRSLADSAPIGRLFASIATLSDMSNQIGQSLAMDDLAGAAKLMKAYATPASMAETATPLPMHFKRRA